jgi:hypothetical protein
MKHAVRNIGEMSRLAVPADYLKPGQRSFGAQDAATDHLGRHQQVLISCDQGAGLASQSRLQKRRTLPYTDKSVFPE